MDKKYNEALIKNAAAIRLMMTGIIVAEYGMIQMLEQKHQLKSFIKDAIQSCRRVQNHFITGPESIPETREVFRQNFNSDELIEITELLKTCFGLKAEGIAEITKAVLIAREPIKTEEV